MNVEFFLNIASDIIGEIMQRAMFKCNVQDESRFIPITNNFTRGLVDSSLKMY